MSSAKELVQPQAARPKRPFGCVGFAISADYGTDRIDRIIQRASDGRALTWGGLRPRLYRRVCPTVDFSEIDAFSGQDIIRDLRNMREHVVDYFQGHGRASQRWFAETPHFRADASSVVGTMIGGRLDWIKFAAAAERLLPKLLAEPIPYSPMHSQRLPQRTVEGWRRGAEVK
jgi:hypothetical protein